ncbi:MAG: PAS domain-containing sensor histidine kinase [bacterium]
MTPPKKTIKLEDYHLSTVLMNMGDGIIMKDKRRKVEFLNQPLIEMYGDQVGQHCFEMFFGRTSPCEEDCPIKEILENGKPSFKHLKKDKYGHWLEITAVPACRETDKPEDKSTSVIGIIRDITKRMNLESELRNRNMELKIKNDELENFVYTVSHDLRSPLVSLQGLAGALMEDCYSQLDDQGKEYLLDIKNSVHRMGLLVRDLLDLSRLSKAQNQNEDVSAKRIIQDSVEQLTLSLKEKNVKLTIGEDMPTVYCNREQIVLALVNLLHNAIKFMGDDNPYPSIAINHTIKDNYHIFSVQDNGIGIEERYFKKIFEIFQTLNEVKDVNSTGVGLTIVKRIIEGHKGQVWVESAKGKGSTFYFSLPVKDYNPLFSPGH